MRIHILVGLAAVPVLFVLRVLLIGESRIAEELPARVVNALDM